MYKENHELQKQAEKKLQRLKKDDVVIQKYEWVRGKFFNVIVAEDDTKEDTYYVNGDQVEGWFTDYDTQVQKTTIPKDSTDKVTSVNETTLSTSLSNWLGGFYPFKSYANKFLAFFTRSQIEEVLKDPTYEKVEKFLEKKKKDGGYEQLPPYEEK